MGVLRFCIELALTIVAPLLLQAWDKRRLDASQRARAWNGASWASAIYNFTEFSMLGWFWVTRRFRGIVPGVASSFGLFVLLRVVVDGLVAEALGLRARAWGEVILLYPIGLGLAVPFCAIASLLEWRRARAAAAVIAVVALLAPARAEAAPLLRPGAEAWADLGRGPLDPGVGIRGVTLGPIESLRHPGRGYGTEASRRALDEAVAMGATWVSLTPFGRVWDLSPDGIDLTFEAPYEENRRNVLAAIDQAHARGLSVLVVPHLWVETGGWRALIEPGGDAEWARWAEAYRAFVLAWAEVAERGGAEMLSVGVELRSWVTGPRAATFAAIVRDVRAVYSGLITYSANWDDVEETLILSELDLIGVNAFYPLTEVPGASRPELALGALRVAEGLERIARAHGKPVLLTEVGYTTREDPALRPWEWPDGMTNVRVDEQAQADAFGAILGPMLDARWCAGFFVWRLYADPDDVSQEAEWGFSPRGKLAELVLRDAFTAYWAVDGPRFVGEALGRHAARTPGVHRWEPWPPLSSAR